MAIIVSLSSSPSVTSRTDAVLTHVNCRLLARGHTVTTVSLRDLPAGPLLRGDAADPAIAAAVELLAGADAVVVTTPVYKAAYSGLLKVFLDLLPQFALRGKAVLPLATGGSPHHMLALDYALRPVLQSLGARHILPGVYASDAQIPKDEAGDYQIGGEIAQRLDDATHTLLQEGLRLSAVPASRPVPFSQALYSV